MDDICIHLSHFIQKQTILDANYIPNLHGTLHRLSSSHYEKLEHYYWNFKENADTGYKLYNN